MESNSNRKASLAKAHREGTKKSIKAKALKIKPKTKFDDETRQESAYAPNKNKIAGIPKEASINGQFTDHIGKKTKRSLKREVVTIENYEETAEQYTSKDKIDEIRYNPKGTTTDRDSRLRLNDIDYEQMEKLALNGWTAAQIADFYNIATDTFNKWLVRDPRLADCIYNSKEIADSRVVRALYERCLGYSHKDTEIVASMGVIKAIPVIRHYPPEVGAIKYWLRCRQPEQWSDANKSQPTGLMQVYITDDISESDVLKFQELKK